MSNTDYSDIGYEINLELDPDSQKIEGLMALAQTIQNLLLTEQGTYPNQPDLGIGISNEQMELLDQTTIDELKDKIDNQIEKFIPTNYSIQTVVNTQNINALSNQKVLVCGFVIKDTKATEVDAFNIIFALDRKKTLFSKIII